MSIFRVPAEIAGQRLDIFLHSELRRTSRTRTQHIVRASAYDASGRRLKPSDRVAADQHVLLWRPPWDEAPVPTDIDILHEDDHLLAVNKPALLPVHPTARYYRNTLIHILKSVRDDEFLSLGHRLDRETSGVLLLCKTRECDRALKKMFEARTGVEKMYVALTWGIPRGVATNFRFECGMRLDHDCRYKVKMRVADDDDSFHSSTVLTVESVRQNALGNSYARVACLLETGRQHQIRLHLATLGSPVVGDKLYGPDESAFARGADGKLTDDDLAKLELPRHALHAARFELEHPMTGKSLAIDAPVPADIEGFWSALQMPRGTLSRST